jgi:hypothetical protein
MGDLVAYGGEDSYFGDVAADATDIGGTSWGDMNPMQKMGMIGKGVSAFSSLAEIYAGFKAMKLAKEQFKFGKQAWGKQWQANIKDYNNKQRDRWAVNQSASAAQGNQYMSENEYMQSRAINPETGGGMPGSMKYTGG